MPLDPPQAEPNESSDAAAPAGEPLVVVHRTSSNAEVQGVLAALREAGLSPSTIGPEVIDETLRYTSAYSLKVPIAVPQSQADQARELIRRREQQELPAVKAAVTSVKSPAIIAGIITAATVPLWWWLVDPIRFGILALLEFIVLFVVLSAFGPFKMAQDTKQDGPDEDDKPFEPD
jgi:hypothetical protein